MKSVEVGFKLKDDGIAPKKGLSKDFGTDLYLREDMLIIPTAIEATLAGVGIHTEFDPEEFGMLITLRSSMSKAPISMANHVGVIEGTYRGEIMVPLRNTLSTRALGEIEGVTWVLRWDEPTKSLKRVPAYKVSDRLHQKVADQLLDEILLVGGSKRDLVYNTAQRKLPRGTILIEKGTRVAQAYMVDKHPINWVERETLSESERGSGGFGSTNKKGREQDGEN